LLVVLFKILASHFNFGVAHFEGELADGLVKSTAKMKDSENFGPVEFDQTLWE